ncbi:unnamed protein product [Prunus armeniaca]
MKYLDVDTNQWRSKITSGVESNVFKGEAYRRGVFSSAIRGVSLEALRQSQISSGSKVSRSDTPCSAWPRLATPSHAFLALNVQLAKQPTASGVFLPPRADARSDAREGMPLKTLVERSRNHVDS